MPACRSRCSSWRRCSPTGGRPSGTKAHTVRPLPPPPLLSPPPPPLLLPSQGPPVHSCRALKHSNLLQCLAQCAEVTPYLLVMEFCPLVSCCPGVPGAFAEPGPSLALPVSGATPSLGASHPP